MFIRKKGILGEKINLEKKNLNIKSFLFNLVSEENLAYFYPTPFASVLGHNDKTYKKVTPDTCARKCLEERDFICRSFDYQVTRPFYNKEEF